MRHPDDIVLRSVTRPRQLACGVEIVREEPVDLKVSASEHFLIGEASANGQLLLELKVRRTKGLDRKPLSASLQQDDMAAASRVAELLRLLLQQP